MSLARSHAISEVYSQFPTARILTDNEALLFREMGIEYKSHFYEEGVEPLAEYDVAAWNWVYFVETE